MRLKARRGWIIPYLKSHFVLLMCTLISPSNTSMSMLQNVKDVHELCRANRHLYELRENSSFQLHLRTDGMTSGNKKMVLRKLKTKCTMTLKVCSACHVSVVIKSMDIPSCLGNCSSCSYFELREPLSNFKTERFCGDRRDDILYFESKTKIVHFDFVQSLHEKFYVSFDVTVKRNLYLYIEKQSKPKYIETPYFPGGYPSDYEAEYNFQVISPYGYVQLLFVDFQLSQGSYIEVSGHNGTRVDIFDGKTFRPPVFISHARYLRLVFRANHQPSSLGFRAMYKFGWNMGVYPIMKPNTDCGGNKDEYGGAIELQAPMSTKEIYDCIWLISPPLFLQRSALLAASISKFRNMESGSTLEFRKGLTSKADVVKFHQCSQEEDCKEDLENSEVMVHAENGFYIRFRGYLKTDSYLLINYYKFQEDNCSKSDFMCNNGKRCINAVLVCDGFYHCSDQSDENDCEVKKNSTEVGQIFRSELTSVTHKYNNVSSDKTFIISTSLGAIAVVSFCICSFGITYVLYQKHINFVESRSHARQRRNAVISSSEEEADTSSVSCIITQDLPPSYEDVLMYNSRYPPLFYTNPEFQETHLDAEFCHQSHNDCCESPHSDENVDSALSEGVSVHMNQIDGIEGISYLSSRFLSLNLNQVSIDAHGKSSDNITYNTRWNDISSSSGPSGYSFHSQVTAETLEHESILQIHSKQSFSDFICSSTDKLFLEENNCAAKQSRDKAHSF